MAAQVTIFDYDFSAYALKIKLLLAAKATPFQRNTVGNLLPRMTLQQLGITYRRIPVLAIGKDEKFTKLKTSPYDAALEAYATSCLTLALPLLPPGAMTPERLRDRVTAFPILARPNIGTLKPSALADWRCIFDVVQNQFLAATPGIYIGGDSICLGDNHVAWLIHWVLRMVGLDKESGFGERSDWPDIYAWLAALPRPEFPEVESETVLRTILASSYSAESVGIDEQGPIELPAGEEVSVESYDTEPGVHLQKGKLHGLSRNEIVLELPTGVRLHFPHRGYILRKA